MISSIRLQNFRSYTDSSFEFGNGVNIIVGPNGSGKTNLLEAILFLARGSSYRVSDSDLLLFGAEWARLDAKLADDAQRTVILQQIASGVRKVYEIDGKESKILSTQKQLPVVLFEPNHLNILQGPPEGRRNYLDDILEQTTPGYSSFRKNYKRVLAQRNSLLKHPRASAQDFFPWNLRLSELGAVIHRARQTFVAVLNKDITRIYQEFARDNTTVSLVYESQFSAAGYESNLLDALEKGLEKDTVRGFTTYGPHREDVLVMFGDKPASLVASRGESRTMTLALKAIELKTIFSTTNYAPILLLDDVFSELDKERRNKLVHYLKQCQTFVTTTDADSSLETLPQNTTLCLG